MYEKFQQGSSVGVTVLGACAIAGGIGAALWGRPYPLVAGIIVGVYFLFAIKVSSQ